MATPDTRKLERHTLPCGYVLPSIHAWPPFFTQQRNPTIIADQINHWIRIILSYARHQRLFVLRVQDADLREDSQWSDIFWNPRIKRVMKPRHLEILIENMVNAGQAAYEPIRQTSSVLIYWRTPEEWAELLHEWATNTGQLNTILTFYEITSPEAPSQFTDVPLPLLRKVLAVLTKTGRAQIIEGAEGGGVRFFAR